jgi:hypothetical protein
MDAPFGFTPYGAIAKPKPYDLTLSGLNWEKFPPFCWDCADSIQGCGGKYGIACLADSQVL